MNVEESADQLLLRLRELETRLEESEQLIAAIKAGEVDAFALNNNNQPEVFTLHSGDYAYRVLVENFSEGALNLSEDGLVVYTNIYFHQLLGLSYEQVIGNAVFQFIHPSSREAFHELFKKGLAGQSKGEINLWAGEKIIPVYVSLTSLYPKLSSVGMIVTDLSEKKKQEQMLERRNKELMGANAEIQRQKNFIASVLESSSQGVLSYVAVREKEQVVDFEIRYANELALEQLNMSADEVIGKRYSSVMALAMESKLRERLMRVLTTRQSEIHEIPSPVYHHRWFRVLYAPLDDGVTCTSIEITEQKEQAKVMEEKNKELEQSNRELASFAYIASHDLQEPLRKIQTFINLVKKNRDDKEALDNYFGKINSSAQRMSDLIQSVLAYTRLTKEGEEFVPTDLNTVLEGVKNDLEVQIKEKNAMIKNSVLPVIRANPLQVQQLFSNLISNSLKFSGDKTLIEISARRATGAEINAADAIDKDRHFIKLCFSDNGIGFEPQYREQIFNLFQRLHPKHEYQGTGIGLSIVKKIVDYHGGYISADSAEGRGAVFCIWLPE